MIEKLTIPDPTLYEFLNGVGNHEIKILLNSVILLQPGQSHSSYDLAEELNDRQGDQPEREFAPRDTHSYCSESLTPIANSIRGSHLEGWKAEAKFREKRIALGGLLADWSLRWPDLSVQHMYGMSRSRPNQQRSPKIRHRIYTALDAAAQEDLVTSMPDLTAMVGIVDITTIRKNVEKMVDLELLTTESKRKTDNRIRIVSTEYASNRMPLEDTQPETQALYAAMAEFGPGTIVTTNKLLDAARSMDSSIDTVKLGIRIRHEISRNKGFPGLRPIDNPEGKPKTTVAFEEAAAEPITELVHGIAALQRGKGIKDYVSKAQEIMDSPEACRALIRKGRIFSASMNSAHRHVHYEQISELLREHGSLTTVEIRRRLIQERDTLMTKGHINVILKELAESNKVTFDQQRGNPHSKITHHSYRLAD